MVQAEAYTIAANVGAGTGAGPSTRAHAHVPGLMRLGAGAGIPSLVRPRIMAAQKVCQVSAVSAICCIHEQLGHNT